MASSTLCTSKGAQIVTPDALRDCFTPPSVGRWHPVPHSRVVDTVKTTLQDAGYLIQKEQHAVMRDGSRYFGTLDLTTSLAEGVSLAVGIRNSVDKSFPLGFCAGNRVFVCDNLAFRSELLVKRRHTRNGERSFGSAIANAVIALGDFKTMETARLQLLRETELSPEQADSLILQSYEKGIIGVQYVLDVLKEWKTPTYGDFAGRTAWSLLNAFTTVLADRAKEMPTAFALQTMRLNALLEPKKVELLPNPSETEIVQAV